MFYALSLALLLAASLAWAFWLLPREVFLNAEAIKADGAANTLHEGFHARRTWVRFWQWLGCTAAGSLPPLLWGGGWGVSLLHFAALGILLAGFFAAAFTPALNVARGKDKYYVSFAPGAASWPDSKLAAEARAKYPNDPAQQIASAGQALERLTHQIISVTAGLSGLLIAVAFFLYY